MAEITLLKPTYKSNIYQSDFLAKGSRLVYGTSGLGGVWGEVDSKESIECLLYAFENGITALDNLPFIQLFRKIRWSSLEAVVR